MRPAIYTPYRPIRRTQVVQPGEYPVLTTLGGALLACAFVYLAGLVVLVAR